MDVGWGFGAGGHDGGSSTLEGARCGQGEVNLFQATSCVITSVSRCFVKKRRRKGDSNFKLVLISRAFRVMVSRGKSPSELLMILLRACIQHDGLIRAFDSPRCHPCSTAR